MKSSKILTVIVLSIFLVVSILMMINSINMLSILKKEYYSQDYSWFFVYRLCLIISIATALVSIFFGIAHIFLKLFKNGGYILGIYILMILFCAQDISILATFFPYLLTGAFPLVSIIFDVTAILLILVGIYNFYKKNEFGFYTTGYISILIILMNAIIVLSIKFSYMEIVMIVAQILIMVALLVAIVLLNSHYKNDEAHIIKTSR